MTFFFAIHPILGGKLDICGRDNLFFALHPILGENWKKWLSSLTAQGPAIF